MTLRIQKEYIYTFSSAIIGAAFQPGAKTVVPGKVIGKFSIRLVPNQEPEEIEQLVFDYINKKVNIDILKNPLLVHICKLHYFAF